MAAKRYFDRAYEVQNKRETRALYEDWAEVYDQELEEKQYAQPGRCAEVLREMLPDGEARILDVACGTGLSGRALRAHGYAHVEGCDYSPEMLEKAKLSKAYDALFETDLNEPPMDAVDESYDAVTAVGAFSFAHVDPDALEEMIRVLKPGGPLIIGINEKYHDEGRVSAKLESLEAQGKLEVIKKEKGAHLPGDDVDGWVIAARKAA